MEKKSELENERKRESDIEKKRERQTDRECVSVCAEKRGKKDSWRERNITRLRHRERERQTDRQTDRMGVIDLDLGRESGRETN